MSVRFGAQSEWWEGGDIAAKQEEWQYVVASFQGYPGGLQTGWNRAACKRCEEQDGKEDYKASLGFNTRTRGYNCYKCHMTGMLPRGHVEKIDEDALDITDQAKDTEASRGPVEQPLGFVPLFSGWGGQTRSLEWGRQFLTGPRSEAPFGAKCRELNWEACEQAGLGVVPKPVHTSTIDQRKLYNRVIVPVPNYRDLDDVAFRGWVARDVTGKSDVPYLNPKGMHRDDLLFNEPALYVQTDDPVLIVEGTMDALRLWPHAVAVLGKPIQAHTQLLKAAKRPVVIMLDGDAWEEGLAFAWTLRIVAPQDLPVGNFRLPAKLDPDDYGLVTPWQTIREQALRTLTM